jgi:hypothetical protein
VLRAALASRDAALNRDELAASEKPAIPRPEESANGRTASATPSRNVRVTDEDVAHELVSLENRLSAGKLVKKSESTAEEENHDQAATSSLVQLVTPPRTGNKPALVTPQPVPDVRTLGLRQAVRALHSAGFRVQLQPGPAASTFPAAGTMAGPGTLVILTRPRE